MSSTEEIIEEHDRTESTTDSTNSDRKDDKVIFITELSRARLEPAWNWNKNNT